MINGSKEHASGASHIGLSNLAITPAQAQTIWYRRAMAQELAASDALDDAELASLRINHPSILEYRRRMLGGGVGTPGYAGWTEFLIDTYGPRRSCLSLGSGLGRVESHLLGRGFASGFDAVELSPGANRGAEARDGRISATSGDLNYVELERERYDFILCHGVLHHLINLEHVLHQIDQALTPDGILLVYEYVGENRWQFTPDRLEGVRRAAPGVPLRVPRPYEVSGFESVRSADLLGLLEHQFGSGCERSVGYGSVYFPFAVCSPECGDGVMGAVLAADERAVSDAQARPCYHMGVYRKTGSPPARARAWTDAEVHERLSPDRPTHVRAADGLRRSAAGPALRRMRRGIRAAMRSGRETPGSVAL